MKRLLILTFIIWATEGQADVTHQVASGSIQFPKTQSQRGSPQQVVKLKGNLELLFNLSALSDKEGREFIDAPSEAKNNTSSTLYYVAYVALFDDKKNLVAVLNSEDVFSRGVAPKGSYQFGTRAVLPRGKSKDVRSYQAVLSVSTEPLQ